MSVDVDSVLAAQWAALREWMGQPAVTAGLEQPSVLAGWTVRDLIAHCARSLTTIGATTVAHGDEPQSLLAYISHYPAAASEITTGTRALAIELGEDLLPAVDRLAREAFAALERITAQVVIAPRGPISRLDFVVTRLMELAVHSDDLARSLPGIAAPKSLDDAFDVVSDALKQAYREKTGAEPAEMPVLDWLRVAAGRIDSADPGLPLL